MSAYGNPYYGYQSTGYPQQTPQNNGIQWVQGEAMAQSWFVAPGQSVTLFDSQSPVFYIKKVEANGQPQPLRIFDYTERGAQQQPQKQYVTMDEVKAYIDSLVKGDQK